MDEKFTRKREIDSGNVTKTIDTHSACLYVSGISFELVNISKHIFKSSKGKVTF